MSALAANCISFPTVCDVLSYPWMAETGNEDMRNLKTTRSDDGKSCEVVGPLSGAQEMINAPNSSHAIISY